MDWYIDGLKKTFDFSGRTSRRGFWTFLIISWLISFIIGFIERLAGGTGTVQNIYTVVLVLPSLALTVRRIHDVGYSGWWYLVPFAILYFAFASGTPGENQYGPEPITPTKAGIAPTAS